MMTTWGLIDPPPWRSHGGVGFVIHHWDRDEDDTDDDDDDADDDTDDNHGDTDGGTDDEAI